MNVFAILAAMAMFAVGWFLGGGRSTVETVPVKQPKPAEIPLAQTQLQTEAQKEARTQELKKELSSVKKALSEEKKKEKEQKKELNSLRKSLKKAKKRAHDAEEIAEKSTKSLREKTELLQKKRNISTEESREKMLAAEQRAALLEIEIKRLKGISINEGSAKKTNDAQSSAPDIVKSSLVASKESNEKNEEKTAEQDRLEEQLKIQRNALRAEFDEQVSKEREQLFNKIREIRKTHQRTLHNLERVKRLANHTDKAYLILKSQLDAALDRLAKKGELQRPNQIIRSEFTKKDEAQTTESVVKTSDSNSDFAFELFQSSEEPFHLFSEDVSQENKNEESKNDPPDQTLDFTFNSLEEGWNFTEPEEE